MINILGGRAGRLWAPVAEKLGESYRAGRECVLLVPEQYTLQAERDALSALWVPGFFRLQVLSPSRFANYVLERAGRDARVAIDERGRLMTMARALWRTREELRFYASAREKPGFAHKLTEAVGELKGAGLTPEDLLMPLEAEQEDSPRLHDLAILYREYESLLAGRLMDREDGEQDLLRRFALSSLFLGADFFVFGFDLLSEPLIRLLLACAAKARGMTVALVMDSADAPDGEAFEPVRESALRLREKLAELGFPASLVFLPRDDTGMPLALSHLERSLLRLRAETFPDFPEGLRLFAAKTPYDEVRRAAAMIKAELLSGTQPGDIAVLMADEGYAPLIPGVFSDYRIPHYLAVKEPILGHALVRCLMDALNCIKAAAWHQEDAVSYLKSPFSPLTREEGFLLENWALRWGLHGKRWTQPGARGEEPEKSEMEALREKAIQPVMRMRDALAKARTASDSIRAVISFLNDLDAHQRVIQLEKTLMEQGLQEEAVRTRQVWDKLCGFFEQMDELLGEERIPLGRFPEWLREGLSMTELSALPPQERCVQAGPLGALMTRGPRAVFLLGLNSASLNLKEEALLSDGERGAMEKKFKIRMSLPLTAREGMKTLDLWKAVSAAGDRLYLSYALSSEQGEALGPQPLLTRIQRMFPKLIEEGGAVEGLRDPAPLAPAAALDEAAMMLAAGELETPWLEAWAWLKSAPEWRRPVRAVINALTGDDPDKHLDKGTSAALFSARTVSVSRLETYAGCPFRHFVQYGLRPQERPEWVIKPVDFGSFCHTAMEGFARLLKEEPAWPDVPRETSDRLMDGVLDALTGNWEIEPWADTARARKEAERYLDILRRAAWTVTQTGQVSAFRPVLAELRFGFEEGTPGIPLRLDNGEILTLRGTIDRVDTAAGPEGTYLRVVDYKTGNAVLNASDLAAGAQLQLLLYLKAALNLLKGHLAAGAFYQPLADPVVRAHNEQEAVKKVREQLRLNGLMLFDPGVIRMMDSGEPPVSLPGYLNKAGEAKDSDRLVSHEGFVRLMALAEEKAKSLAEEIYSGAIPRSPLIRASGRAECAFCEYKGVCRQDQLSRERLLRRFPKVSFSDLSGQGGEPGAE